MTGIVAADVLCVFIHIDDENAKNMLEEIDTFQMQ